MRLEALIFDVDGTLAETEEAHRQAFNRAFAEAGVGWQWDEAEYKRLLQVPGGKERLAHYLATAEPSSAPPEGDGEAWIAGLHKRKTVFYVEIVASGAVEMRRGILPLVEAALAEGLRLAIATTTHPDNVERLLLSAFGADWPGRFEVIAAGDAVARKKPAADVFELVLQRLALRAEQCLAIEDSTMGVRSARAAGIPTIVTRSVYTDDSDFPGALAVVDELPELAGALPPEDAGALGRAILARLRQIHAGAG